MEKGKGPKGSCAKGAWHTRGPPSWAEDNLWQQGGNHEAGTSVPDSSGLRDVLHCRACIAPRMNRLLFRQEVTDKGTYAGDGVWCLVVRISCGVAPTTPKRIGWAQSLSHITNFATDPIMESHPSRVPLTVGVKVVRVQRTEGPNPSSDGIKSRSGRLLPLQSDQPGVWVVHPRR